MSQKNRNKKNILKLYKLLKTIYDKNEKDNKNEKYEILKKNILEIQENMKSQQFIYINIYQQKYFNELLNIIYNYYNDVRDSETEIIYNDLLSLLETSLSS